MENQNDCPFQNYAAHIRFLRGNSARGHANFLVVHGPSGAGKNTIAGNIALDLKPDFDIRHDIIHTQDDLLRNLVRCADMPREEAQTQVRIINEGADMFLNRDWNTVENKEGTKIQRKVRILGGTTIICLPDFEGLDPYLREYWCWQRIYQPLDFDADGFKHTPAKVLWRNEWFDYREQRVMHRWTDVYDLNVPSLDKHPQWLGYEQDKRSDIKSHATRMLARINEPAHLRRKGLPAPAKTPKARRSVAKANGATVVPPTTT